MRRNDPVPKYDIGPILESLGATLPFSRRSGWQQMRCPFHTDTHPSASVNFTSNRFHCFSCGASGDGIDLIQEHNNLSFADANEEAARLSGPGDGGVRQGFGRGHTIFGE